MDHWAILDHFLTIFWTFFGTIFQNHFIGGGRPLVLRQGWDAVYQYSERGGKKTVVIEMGVEDELLAGKEEWEVDVLVTLLIYGVFIESYKLF